MSSGETRSQHEFWCASHGSQLCKGPRKSAECNCKGGTVITQLGRA